MMSGWCAMDIRVLDDQGNEIELHDDEDDDVVYTAGGETYVAENDDTLEDSGYRVRSAEDGDPDISSLLGDLSAGDDNSDESDNDSDSDEETELDMSLGDDFSDDFDEDFE